jgi:hypothetical protein
LEKGKNIHPMVVPGKVPIRFDNELGKKYRLFMMKRTIPVACGPSEEEIKEREKKERRDGEAKQALEKVRLESDAMLDQCLHLHQRFLKARKENDSGNPPPTLDEKMVFPTLSRGGGYLPGALFRDPEKPFCRREISGEIQVPGQLAL